MTRKGLPPDPPEREPTAEERALWLTESAKCGTPEHRPSGLSAWINRGQCLGCVRDQIRAAESAEFERGRAQGRREEREACAFDAAIHSQYPVTTDYDRGYSQARKDAAAKIRGRADGE